MKLFRQEAVDAQGDRFLGTISLAQPLSMWVMSGIAACMAIAVCLFLVFGEYTRRHKVTGVLVPDLGLSTAFATSAGVVTSVVASEGDHVEKLGKVLEVVSPRSTAAGTDANEAIRSNIEQRRVVLVQAAENQLEQLVRQEEGARTQLAQLREEFRHATAEVGLREQQIQLGQRSLERVRGVAEKRFVSQMQVEQQEQAVVEAKAAKLALERQLSAISRSMAQMEQLLSELPARRAEVRSSLEMEMSILNQEKIQFEANQFVAVNASTGGVVANRLVEVGQSVQPGQPLFTVVPDGSRLQAHFMVPSGSIGFVKPGDRVILRYRAFPYQKFGHHMGQVDSVSRGAVGPNQGQAEELLFRVVVGLDKDTVTAYGREEKLLPGMVVDAEILGDRRRLYEWFLEPLYSIGGWAASDNP